MAPLHKLLATDAPAAVLLVRLKVSEGTRSSCFPMPWASVGSSRSGFLPLQSWLRSSESRRGAHPGPIVFEIVCGILLVLGLLTCLAAIPMIIDMLVATGTTKSPILPKDGF